jgi:hypothetical protein
VRSIIPIQRANAGIHATRILGLAEAKIAHLHPIVLVHKEVKRLNVAMDLQRSQSEANASSPYHRRRSSMQIKHATRRVQRHIDSEREGHLGGLR